MSIVAAVLLTGCGGTVYRTDLQVYCPPIQNYSQEHNESLADELDALPEGYYAIPSTIADYAKLRDRIRACESEKDNL
jgi:hypothetical protein